MLFLLGCLFLWSVSLCCAWNNAATVACGREVIAQALHERTVRWVRRTHPGPRYAHCAVTSARYNCSRFTTSAADYRIDWFGSKETCQWPSRNSLLAALRTTPRRVMLIGDSHVQQVYQALLCMYQDEARHIIAYISPPQRLVNYSDISVMPECHSVSYASYPRFHLQPVAMEDLKPGARCTLNHSPPTPSCFRLPSSTSAGDAYSLVCAAYVRPLEGMPALVAGLSKGLAHLNLTLSDFEVLVANTYLNSTTLGEYLKLASFHGIVLAIPRFSFAPQMGIRLTKRVLGARAQKKANETRIAYDVKTFCRRVKSAWGVLPNGSDCTPLDFAWLSSQRNRDAKASIYPMSYRDAVTNETRVCHQDQLEAQLEPRKCDNISSVLACEKTPCAEESHFCLPGPPDDFALLVLGSALQSV